MTNVAFIPVVVPQNAPDKDVRIEYTDNYKRQNGLSREIDRPAQSLERTEECDNFVYSNNALVGAAPQMKALKLPSTAEIIKGMAVIPVVLETGKQILVGIFDLYDTWNSRPGRQEHNLQAVVLPDEVSDAILAQRA